MEPIGQQIRAERKRRNMSADEVGLLIGRKSQTVYLYERGQAEPSGEAMLLLIQHGFVAVPAAEDAA